jgi:uncharacterized protein
MLKSGKSEGAAIRAASAAVSTDAYWEDGKFLHDKFLAEEDAWSEEAREASLAVRRAAVKKLYEQEILRKEKATNEARNAARAAAGAAERLRKEKEMEAAGAKHLAPEAQQRVAEIHESIRALEAQPPSKENEQQYQALHAERQSLGWRNTYGVFGNLRRHAVESDRKTVQRDPMGRLAAEFETEEDFDDPDELQERLEEIGADEASNMEKLTVGAMQVVGDIAHELQMVDAIELDDAAKVRFIDGGYLSAFPRIARTGIQTYRGDECGKPDMEFVAVYRPEDEVFAKDATHSYTHLPVTSNHPGVLVDARNWSKYAKGDTGDEVLRDGGSVRVPMMLRDHATIKEFKDGKNQLSVGYTCDLDWTSGTTADGEKFDAIQRNIKANHLALVAAARGGPTLKIGDDDAVKGDTTMTAILKNVVIDGVQVEMSDTAAQVVQRALMQMQAKLDEWQKKAKASEEEEENNKEEDAKKDAALKAKDAKIATLEQQLKDNAWTPAKLDAEVKVRQRVIDKAQALLGKNLITDNRTVEDIRKQVVEFRLGATANGWDDNQIRSSFDTLTAEIRQGGTIRDAATAFSRPHFVRDQDPKQAAYDAYDQEMANAWKGPSQQRA